MTELNTTILNTPPPAVEPPAVTPPPVVAPPAVTPPTNSLALPQNWQSQLSEDLRDEPSLKMYSDIASMAKSLVHSQKAIGANKIVKPSEHATEEDWKNFFHEVGLPKDVNNYEVKFEDATGTIKPEFVGKFKEQAFKNGVMPKQAQALLDWFVGTNTEQANNLVQQGKLAQEQTISELKKTWGEAYDKNLTAASMVLKEFSKDDEFEKFLDESGFGDNPHVIKFMSKLGNQMFEDRLQVPGARGAGALTPAEAEMKINTIMGDTKHPYWDKSHPNHVLAIEEMAKLHSAALPESKE